MNRKNASRVIGMKVKEWKKSLPEDLQKVVEGNVIVTGGCIASLLLGEEVNDFDLYFRNVETVKALADHYVGVFLANRKGKSDIPVKVRSSDDRVSVHIQSAGIAAETSDTEYQYFEGTDDDSAEEYIKASDASDKGAKYRPVFLTQNAITLSADVQIVLRFFGDPAEIHLNYDFVHCTNYWQDLGLMRLILNQPALEALLSKELRYTGSLYPLCSVFRTRKFLLRGWSCNAGQYLKMCFQIAALDLTDPAILEDQLVGVDTAYFLEIIKLVKEQKEKGKPIDATYIAQIVERVF